VVTLPLPLSADPCPEAWPYLDQAVLQPSRSRQVCLTCHWFRHHAAASCIPLLTCRLHHGLIAHGEHLTRRCRGRPAKWCKSLGSAPA
jgi:hypothetical protein